jgi:hypothetical protein
MPIGFQVEVAVQRVSVQADVDTGTEVNVLSKTVFDKLDPKPPIKQYVTMTQVGHNVKMNGFIVGPVKIQLSRCYLAWNSYGGENSIWT